MGPRSARERGTETRGAVLSRPQSPRGSSRRGFLPRREVSLCAFGLGTEGKADYREVVVAGGEVLHLPSELPHSCRALEDTLILDLFSPPSATTGVDRMPAGAGA